MRRLYGLIYKLDKGKSRSDGSSSQSKNSNKRFVINSIRGLEYYFTILNRYNLV